MANDLLTSFTAASRAHSHIVFNERTQEFERAGRRHAIASFFGFPDARAARQALLPHFISNGADNRSLVFNPLYTVNVEESGDLELKISNLPGSAISLDWTITIHPDGTHYATDPIVSVQDP